MLRNTPNSVSTTMMLTIRRKVFVFGVMGIVIKSEFGVGRVTSATLPEIVLKRMER
jgi:hypothetical protein